MLALKKHKLDAWFGSDSLRDADHNIQIVNIAREPSTRNINKGSGGRRFGRFRQPVYRDVLKITIEFTLYEFSDIEARESAIEAANAWARDDGYLEISPKLGRRVWVQCSQRAEIKDARNHKEAFRIVFETDETPYWEDAQPTVLTFTGLSADETARVPGTRECAPADVTITPSNGTLTSLSLTLGESAMAFSGLNIASGASLILSHDDTGRLVIRDSLGVSCYDCRAGSSDDELTAEAGTAAIGFSANVACDVRFEVRGRYK